MIFLPLKNGKEFSIPYTEEGVEIYKTILDLKPGEYAIFNYINAKDYSYRIIKDSHGDFIYEDLPTTEKGHLN